MRITAPWYDPMQKDMTKGMEKFEIEAAERIESVILLNRVGYHYTSEVIEYFLNLLLPCEIVKPKKD